MTDLLNHSLPHSFKLFFGKIAEYIAVFFLKNLKGNRTMMIFQGWYIVVS